jgi:heat shock protein HslJ
MACPPDSQADQFLSELAAARFFFIEVGTLSIEVSEDGTTMQLMTADEVAQGAAPDDTTPESADFLTSGTWQWTGTSDPLGITTVNNPSSYTVAFGADGSAVIGADCNTVLATYTVGDDGALTIALGPSTLAACGPESRDAEFLQSLAAVVGYFGEGDNLALEMVADGGVLSLARMEETIVTQPEGQPGDAALVGPTWQWTVLRQLNGETAVPEPVRYTLTFNGDGTVAIQADCGVAGGTYTTASDGSLSIVVGPSTQDSCGAGSLDQVFLGGLGAAQGYALENGALTITLQLENGTMILVPAN